MLKATGRSAFRPAPARQGAQGIAAPVLFTAVVGGAAVLTAVTVLQGRAELSLLVVVALSAGFALGEALRVDLPYGRGGTASFGLGDAALAVGLLVTAPVNLVAAAVGGMLLLQVRERMPVAKFVFNTAQFVAATSVAGLVFALFTAQAGLLGPRHFVAVVCALAAFLLLNTATVATMIAINSSRGWRRTVAQLLPTAAIIAAANVCVGLLAVLVAGTHPWATPALVVPLLLVYLTSHHEVQARQEQERSVAFVGIEQRLNAVTTPAQACAVIADGVADAVGCHAAVWHEGAWQTPVPDGAERCEVEPKDAVPVITTGRALGLPVRNERCAAVNLGGAVLAVWPEEHPLSEDGLSWLGLVARSTRGIFERAAASQVLEQERATLRAVVDGTANGIVVVDGTGIIRLWNPAMAQLAGATPGQALGRPVGTVLGQGPWMTEGVHDVSRPEEGEWRLAVSGVRDQRHGWMRVAVVHDVSAERRVARMKEDTLAVVSHELRTPLTPIRASAQMLRRRWQRMSSEQREELLEQIEGRSEHLIRLVEDLLLVAQLSTSSTVRPRIALTEANLANVLRSALADFGTSRPDHHVDLEAPKSLPAFTDPVRVRQIVTNIVDNACKFSPEGSTVRVTLLRNGRSSSIEVADQGRGIPADDLERVFERFERVEDPMHMTTSGAGLGLYIVRALVHALGGKLQIRSVLGRGTTITVRLPLRAPEPPPARQAPQEQAPEPSSTAGGRGAKEAAARVSAS